VSLAHKLLFLISNERLRRKLGDEAFNTVKCKVNWYKSSEKLRARNKDWAIPWLP
jgi:hypothetical protein